MTTDWQKMKLCRNCGEKDIPDINDKGLCSVCKDKFCQYCAIEPNDSNPGKYTGACAHCNKEAYEMAYMIVGEAVFNHYISPGFFPAYSIKEAEQHPLLEAWDKMRKKYGIEPA